MAKDECSDRRRIIKSVRFTEDHYEKIKERADRTGRAPSTLIHDAMMKILNEPLPKQQRRVPTAEQRSLAQLVSEVGTLKRGVREIVDGSEDPLEPPREVGDLASNTDGLMREVRILVQVMQSYLQVKEQPKEGRS